MKFSAAILTGGFNSRMDGHLKALTLLQGRSILAWQLDILRPLFDNIIIAGAPGPPEESLPIISDSYPHKGPLAGIHAALSYSPHPFVFIFSCDMPFLSTELIRMMCHQMSQQPCEALLPIHPAGKEPLHAIYSTSLASKAEKLIKLNKLSVQNMARKADMQLFEVSPLLKPEKIFFNINSPQDIISASKKTSKKQVDEKKTSKTRLLKF